MKRVRWIMWSAVAAAIVLAPSASTAAVGSHAITASGFRLPRGGSALAFAPRASAPAVARVPSVPAADPPKATAPLLTLDDMMVVPSVHLVFLSGTGTVSGQDLAVYSMTSNTFLSTPGLTGESGASGMVLDGSTLYVERCAAGEIDAVDVTTLTVTGSIPIPTGTAPCSLALADGQLWFPDAASNGLAAVQLTSPYTVSTYAETGGTLSEFASAPLSATPDLLVGWHGTSPDTVDEFDTSQTPPVAGPTGTITDVNQAVVTPDGTRLVVADTGSDFSIYSLADLSTPQRTYTLPYEQPIAAAVNPTDGFVATVTNEFGRASSEADVYVFPIDQTTAGQTWRLAEASSQIDKAQAGFSGNSQVLFVATQTSSNVVTLHALPEPDRLPDTLSVTASRYSIRYGSTVTVTATLGHWTTNRSVTIWQSIGGAHYRALGSGQVGPLHHFTLVLRPSSNTSYYAVYAGDSGWLPATSTAKLVYVHVVVTGKLTGYYGTSGGYHLYHPGVHPVYTAKVAPNIYYRCVTFVLERHYSTGWRYVDKCVGVNSQVEATVYVTGLTAGVEYRIGAAYEDSTHAVGGTPWSYFRVT